MQTTYEVQSVCIDFTLLQPHFYRASADYKWLSIVSYTEHEHPSYLPIQLEIYACSCAAMSYFFVACSQAFLFLSSLCCLHYKPSVISVLKFHGHAYQVDNMSPWYRFLSLISFFVPDIVFCSWYRFLSLIFFFSKIIKFPRIFSKKKKVLVLLMMLLDDEEHWTVERKCWTRQ